MNLVDANLLLYSVDTTSPFHPAAYAWLDAQLNGSSPVALPWISLVAFVRISTNPRAASAPLAPADAMDIIDAWLEYEVAWTPSPGSRHQPLFAELVRRHQLTANLVSDAHVAALAIEHGLTVCSVDTDFARFPELRWINPLA